MTSEGEGACVPTSVAALRPRLEAWRQRAANLCATPPPMDQSPVTKCICILFGRYITTAYLVAAAALMILAAIKLPLNDGRGVDTFLNDGAPHLRHAFWCSVMAGALVANAIYRLRMFGRVQTPEQLVIEIGWLLEGTYKDWPPPDERSGWRGGCGPPCAQPCACCTVSAKHQHQISLTLRYWELERQLHNTDFS